MRVWSVMAALLLSSGCNRPAKIEIDPAHPILTGKSETIQLRATVRDQSGNVMGGVPVKWTAMTPTMATVDENGTVRPVTSGAATILAQAGKLSKEIEVQVQIPKRIVIDPDHPMLMLGVTKGFKATVLNDRDLPMIIGEMRWSTSDPAIFTVDNLGNVKTLQEGEAVLTVDAGGIQTKMPVKVKHEELHEDGSLTQ